MRTFFTPIQYEHAPAKEFLDGAWGDYHESPRRPRMILEAIAAGGLGEVIPPADFGLEPIRAVHADHYLEYLRTAYARWVDAGRSPDGVYPDTFFRPGFMHRPENIVALAGLYAFDMSTVLVAQTWEAAYWSAQCALTAARLVRDGERAAFALCRPPGHHAHADVGGGYCFVNNVAVAAHWLTSAPGEARVAILDIDFHHGNGTQAIFYERSDVLFISLHADPDRQYPYFLGGADERGVGAGAGFNINYPLPIKTTDDQYMAALDRACDDIARYAPRFLLISLGVDTFGGDPLGDFALTHAAFPRIGARLAQLNLPTVFVMEGGYAIDDLGTNVVGVLASFRRNSEF
jgi:acetoin utilization deacetylase AcuC-like enzyme